MLNRWISSFGTPIVESVGFFFPRYTEITIDSLSLCENCHDSNHFFWGGFPFHGEQGKMKHLPSFLNTEKSLRLFFPHQVRNSKDPNDNQAVPCEAPKQLH